MDDGQHRMENVRDIDELHQLERFCLDLADEAGTAEGRAALLSMAANYRGAVERTLLACQPNPHQRPC